MEGKPDRRAGTGCDAGTATRATAGLQMGTGHTAQHGNETNSRDLAAVATDAAIDTSDSEAVLLDDECCGPWNAPLTGIEGNRLTGLHTVTTETAAAPLEINLRISAGPGDQDLLRAGIDTTGATIANIGERVFLPGPRRSRGHMPQMDITPQELTP